MSNSLLPAPNTRSPIPEMWGEEFPNRKGGISTLTDLEQTCEDKDGNNQGCPMKELVESFYGWYRQMIRHAKYRWVIIIGTLLYLFSPIDIAPDFIPILGFIDDGIIATVLVAELSQLLLDRLGRNKEIKVSQEVAGEKAASETVVDVPAQ